MSTKVKNNKNTPRGESKPSAGTVRVKMFELLNIEKGLDMLNGIGSVRLGMHRGDLSRPIGDKLSSIRKFMEDKDFRESNEKLDRVDREYCLKDDNGVPVSDMNGYIFSAENRIKRDEAVEKLKEKEKELFGERQKRIDEYNGLLKDECEIDLPMIPMSLLEAIEKDYVERKLDSPFKTEVFDLLSRVIDRTA